MAGPYREGRVHVLAEKCPTCVFRPGNLMMLEAGRLKDLVDSNVQAQSALTCHATLYGQTPDEAVCRGFYDSHKTLPLQLAERMGLIELDDVPTKGEGHEPEQD